MAVSSSVAALRVVLFGVGWRCFSLTFVWVVLGYAPSFLESWHVIPPPFWVVLLCSSPQLGGDASHFSTLIRGNKIFLDCF